MDYTEEYSKVFDLETSSQNYEKFSTSTGFGMARDVDEAEEIGVSSPEQGFDVTLRNRVKV